ncbi:hypothetical protein BOW35_12890 [Solemya velum gill symbiont]|nr:hypothetical protein BOW35_12890 [Solemya velum gill symbiont]
MLSHLPPLARSHLLTLLNDAWTTNTLPPDWRHALVIPIAKPGKDSTQANNYRPISLTSCLCKTFERMINNRLVWILESQNLLSPLQCGFRKQRSTIDHLIRLDSYVKKAFSRSEHAVTIFFDLEKAYDTTWKYGILKDLHKLGFRGRLPLFILNFLQDRTFQVRIGSTLSDTFQQEMGVPQGSVLSVTLLMIFQPVADLVTCHPLKRNYSHAWTGSPLGPRPMVLNFLLRKLFVFISVENVVCIQIPLCF